MKRQFCLKTRWSAVLLFFLGLGVPLLAAERTWDGSSRDSDWTAPGNWAGLGGAPVPGDSLRFPAGALHLSNSNDYPANTIFSALTYAGAGYTARGNSIALSNGVSVTHASGNTILYLPITLRDDQVFSVSQTAANLYLFGDIKMGIRSLDFSGPGDFVVFDDISSSGFSRGSVQKLGAGTLLLMGHATYEGPTLVNGGTLRVDGSLSNSLVTVNSGAMLTGLGKVAGLRANSGATVQPGGTTPQIFTSVGDAELNAGSTLNIRIDGPTLGLNYAQLRVQGAVTLGGTLNLSLTYTPAVGTEFTIIDNDGSDDITGTFAGMPEGHEFIHNGRPFRISYGARFGGIFGRENDVTIEAIPALCVWDSGGGVNNLWSQPLNWSGDIIPFPGDDIQFGSNFVTSNTTNDFPGGRLFGSLLLVNARPIVGNAFQVDGRIHVIGGGTFDINPPVTLKGGILQEAGTLNLHGPMSLIANQTFRNEAGTLNVIGSPTLNGHDLTVDANNLVYIRSPLVSPGELTKRGAGRLLLSGTNACPISVDAGTLSVETHGLITAPIIVNTGAVLNASGNFHELEVRPGATLVPAGHRLAKGDVELMSGSTLHINISTFVDSYGAKHTVSSGLIAYEDVEISIAGCNLSVSVTPDADRTTSLPILYDAYSGADISGTFAGLPEGAVFLVGDRAYTITYQGGDGDNDVVLYPVNTFVWDGGGIGPNWMTPSNWTPNFAPLPYSHLVFPANVAKVKTVNNFPPGAVFASLTFQAPLYGVSGNPFVVYERIDGYYDGEVNIDADLLLGIEVQGNLQSTPIGLTSTARLHLEGMVTGPATKAGDGRLRLAGPDANAAEFAVGAGWLELDKQAGVNAASRLTISNGVALLLNDDQISNSGTVTVNGAGRFDVSGQSEQIDRLDGDGIVDLSERFFRSGRLTVQRGAFAGRIEGAGILTKTGSQLLTLTGVNPFTGTTILANGELRMDNVQTNSTIGLDGGLLTGRGYVGPINGNLGGTVQPGFGGAQFDSALHAGNIAFNSTTTFRTVMTSSSPDFEGHKLQVAGTINLGASRLVIDLFGNFRPTNTASFVIIENDKTDAIVGTFAGLPQGGTLAGEGFLFQISYTGGTGNDVTLTRVRPPPATMLSAIPMTSDRVHVRGLGHPGVQYGIQTTAELHPGDQWFSIGGAIADFNGIFEVDHYFFVFPGQPLPREGFYRAISP